MPKAKKSAASHARARACAVPWHATKIVCTLGPATDAPGVLNRLIGAGMDIARLNMSHGDHASHARRIKQVRELARKMGQPVAILADLPGPKFRLGNLAGGSRELRLGETVILAAHPGSPEELPVRQRELLNALAAGESVHLADGAVKLQVKSAGGDRITSRVLAAGTVRSGSGINAPESAFSALIPTEEDRRHIRFAAAQGVEWIGVSFVQTAGDLARIRACLPAGQQPLVLAKIEKRRALIELDAILEAADALMVARGDLGVETDLAEIPLVQKRIIARANLKGRPVITATQMLESMVEQEQPTRAEVTDVANAVLDGTDAVMLSAETAIGGFPVSAAGILHRVLTATEREHGLRMALERLRASAAGLTEDPISFVACELAARLDARAIIVAVHELSTALAIARFRPRAPLVAVTDSEILCRQLAAVWGVAPLFAADASADTCVAETRRWLFERKLARPGDPVVSLCHSATRDQKADALQIVRL